jgi:hypothetical protein
VTFGGFSPLLHFHHDGHAFSGSIFLTVVSFSLLINDFNKVCLCSQIKSVERHTFLGEGIYFLVPCRAGALTGQELW